MGAAPSSPSPHVDPLVAARVRREEGEAERARAEAERARAATRRDDTEAERARAAMRRDDTEAERARRARQASSAAVAAIVTTLAIDWAVHAHKPFIRWRVKWRLQAGALLQRAVRAPVKLLPSVPVQLRGSFLPTLLYGPSGCGKSLYLSQLARQVAATRVPVALVRFRQPKDSSASASAKRTIDSGAMRRMATELCSQVGYPIRDPVLVLAWQSLRSFRISGAGVEVDVKLQSKQASQRAQDALTTLFEAAKELRTQAPTHSDAAAPVLLFDEVHDLMRDDRLRDYGGKEVFMTLSGLMVAYGTDERVAHIVVAGSSFLFVRELHEASTITRSRTACMRLPDPPVDAVVTALVANGYTEAQAQAMVSLCGPRLRLLEAPLQRGPSDAAGVYETFTSQCRSAAAESLRAVFGNMSPGAQVQQLAHLLDRIEAADASGADRPKLRDLQKVKNGTTSASSIIFIDESYQLYFQSNVVRALWGELRAELSASPS